MAGENTGLEKSMTLPREVIEEIRGDLKDDQEVQILCDMAIAFLRFFNRVKPYRVLIIEDIKRVIDGHGAILSWPEVEEMLNQRVNLAETLEECCKAVRRQVTSTVDLPTYLNSTWGRNPGKAMLNQFIAGRITLEKFGTLMELSLGEIEGLKAACRDTVEAEKELKAEPY